MSARPTEAPSADASASAPDGRGRPAALAGIVGGLIGATCCVGPAIGVATGAGAGSFLLALGGYRVQAFAVGALAALGIGAWLLGRRRRACPTEASYRTLRSRWIDVGVLVFALTYALGRFLIPRLIERL
ncbi:MAG TPA: hypothetical protein VFK59_04525 [Actinomycetota bacterium]|nr:hypothetical protein [Actinomycetota bacterium]